jgi:hypothetical protein
MKIGFLPRREDFRRLFVFLAGLFELTERLDDADAVFFFFLNFFAPILTLKVSAIIEYRYLVSYSILVKPTSSAVFQSIMPDSYGNARIHKSLTTILYSVALNASFRRGFSPHSAVIKFCKCAVHFFGI